MTAALAERVYLRGRKLFSDKAAASTDKINRSLLLNLWRFRCAQFIL
jgi:hypothetical protein